MKIRARWVLVSIALLVILPALGLSAWVWGTLHYSYSSGERTGYVQKISKKGWVCKTWEGELQMTSVPGSAPQLFLFSVPDEKVANQIMAASGHPLSLIYEQHKGVPSACFAETEYFVTGMKTVTQ
jgi:hypothetical protein